MSKRKKISVILFILFAISAAIFIYLKHPFGEKIKLTTLIKKERPAFYKDNITILGVGVDEKTDGRTDTIILAHLNIKNYKLKLLSIPRDTLVYIPKIDREEKINHAYRVGGIELTIKTLENFLQLPIDYYIVLNYDGFKKIVDLIGGVEVFVERRMYYVDRRGGLYINLKKGHQLLDGDKALQYVRFRQDKFGDLSRIKRQQKFMELFFEKAIDIKNLPKLPEILNILQDDFATNFNKLQMLELIRLSKKIQDIDMATLEGLPVNINNVSYIKVSDEMKNKTIAKLFYEADYDNNSKMKVAVIPNWLFSDETLQKIISNLEKLGFNVEIIGNEGLEYFNFGCDENCIVISDDNIERIKDILKVLPNFELIKNKKLNNEFDVNIIISESH